MRLKKPTLIEILVMVAIVAVLAALVLPGYDHDTTPRYPVTAVPGVVLARLAGDYYRVGSRGGGWHLSILPDGRYSFVWSGCVGVLHREAGQARELGGHIILMPEKANTKKIPRDLLPIRWGERTYLLQPDECPKFSQAIFEGSEPSEGSAGNNYLSNLGRADGLPDLPEKWLAPLRAQLATGKIIEASDEGSWAKVAVGRQQGVKVGDRLILQGYPRLQLRVKTITDDSCLVEAPDIGDNHDVFQPGRNVLVPRPEIQVPDQ